LATTDDEYHEEEDYESTRNHYQRQHSRDAPNPSSSGKRGEQWWEKAMDEAGDVRDQQLAKLRRFGLVLAAAVVLLPSLLLGLLLVGSGVLYVCVKAVRKLMTIKKRRE